MKLEVFFLLLSTATRVLATGRGKGRGWQQNGHHEQLDNYEEEDGDEEDHHESSSSHRHSKHEEHEGKDDEQCVSIKTTTACAPWSGKDLFIDSKKLRKVYGIAEEDETPFTAQVWESLLLKTTGGGKAQASLWREWASCPSYRGEHLQYLRSYTCMSDIFVHSADCNKKATGQTPVCPEVCDNYGGAVKRLMENEDVCPVSGGGHDDEDEEYEEDKHHHHHSKGQTISERRSFAKKALKSCRKINKMSAFNQKEQCVAGVKSDQDSCGFSGSAKVAAKYCKKHPKATCCTSLASTDATSSTSASSSEATPSSVSVPASASYQDDSESLMGSMKRIAMMWGATSIGGATNPSSPARNFFQSTAFIVICVTAGIIVFAVFGFIYARRRRMQYHNAGFVSLKNSNGGGASVPLFDKSIDPTSPQGQLRCMVKYDYTPNLSDEIELKIGDIIVFESISDDGWGDARNVTTGQVGKACTRFTAPIPK